MLRFKLGCHALGIVTGRFQSLPRQERLCHSCDMGALDDERHRVFECPSFENLCAEHRHLFGREVAFDMRLFFAHKDQQSVVPSLWHAWGLCEASLLLCLDFRSI